MSSINTYRKKTSDCSLNGQNGTVNATSDQSTGNGTKWVLPAEEYYSNRFLQISSGVDDLGEPLWYIVLCLLAAWTVVFLALLKGVKSIGKVGSTHSKILMKCLLAQLTERYLTQPDG